MRTAWWSPHREAENAYIVSRDDMDKTLQLISNCSLYAFEEELRRGGT